MELELKRKKLLYFATAYMTNINYLIVLILLSTFLEFEKNPYLSLIIWGIPGGISTIISFFIIRNNLKKNQSHIQGILYISIAHSLSLLGLIGAFIYLFI